jgi:hypothetical protein
LRFPLGAGDKPQASRRGKYLPEWIRANGGPPAHGDRLSPNVFVRRYAQVEIGDTRGSAPYPVVRKIIEWETGSPGHSVSQPCAKVRLDRYLPIRKLMAKLQQPSAPEQERCQVLMCRGAPRVIEQEGPRRSSFPTSHVDYGPSGVAALSDFGDLGSKTGLEIWRREGDSNPR